MMMPTIFGESLLDDFFRFPDTFNRRSYNTKNLMQTDIAERDNEYEVTMDLPGFQKEDITAEMKDGYLVISASTSQNNDQTDENGRYIRRERYSGSCSRSFYVGKELTQEDIKARFENGTLKLTIPKKEAKPEVEQTKYIAIEG